MDKPKPGGGDAPVMGVPAQAPAYDVAGPHPTPPRPPPVRFDGTTVLSDGSVLAPGQPYAPDPFGPGAYGGGYPGEAEATAAAVRTSVQLVLFVLGWLFVLPWWVGACLPACAASGRRGSPDRGLWIANVVMTVLSVSCIAAAVIVCLVLGLA